MSVLSLLRRRDPFTPLERALLDALAERLQPEARQLLGSQIAQVNRVNRLTAGKEVNVYRLRHGKPTFDQAVAFPNQVEEAKLAVITFRAAGRPKAIRVDFWLVKGLLFEVQFDQSPKGIRPDEIEVKEVKVRLDPMVSAPVPARALDPAALTDWLGAWHSRYGLADVKEPLPLAERARLLSEIDATLPADYLEMIAQTEGFMVNRCRVHGLSETRSVALPDASVLILAEAEGQGALFVKEAQPEVQTYFFGYNEGDSAEMGASFRVAVESVFLDQASSSDAAAHG